VHLLGPRLRGDERFNCQTAKHHRPVFSDAGASSFRFPPPGGPGNRPPQNDARGRSAERRGQQSRRRCACETVQACLRWATPGREVCETRCAARRLSALHARRFWAPGPCFRARKAGCSPADPAAPAAFHPHQTSSHRRRPHIVGADGDRGLPERDCESRRRRRIPLHHQNASGGALAKRDLGGYTGFL
jgi:hypothetical protein